MSPLESIAHYRITAKLAEGGMGAVYRATDTKLNREVAIKVLPDAFAADPDRLARFSREAQVLASLNHPNIGSIYGIEERALVLELVEGPTLADLISQGPIRLTQALAIAQQLTDALEYAHEKNVIHRDLKPANIKITPGGKVKILDFGLAKALSPEAYAANPASSATLTMKDTMAGVILGTAAYMSPEQARGQYVDKRADIWSFGVVLYEMVTGRQLFSGTTISDTLASVLRHEPAWEQVPQQLRKLLRCCLAKDPSERLRDIGDARMVLDEPSEPVTSPAPQRAFLPWIAAALALVVAAIIGSLVLLRPKAAEPVTVRFLLPVPEGAIEARSPATPQVMPSPDGRRLAFIARSPDGTSALWVRAMGSPTAHKMDKTDGATFPFWSPDSQFIAFFADRKLKKLPIAGGSPHTVWDAPSNARAVASGGGTWNAEGDIVFATGRGSPLMRVEATGGPATPVSRLDESLMEDTHSWPQFLADGRHFLYFAHSADPEKSAIYVQELGSWQRILIKRSRLPAAWSAPGYLLFAREETLFAQRMDPKSFQLSGQPVSIAEEVSFNEASGRSAFAVAGGVLVYRGDWRTAGGQLTWYDRDGKRLGTVGKPGEYQSVRLSPDEKSAALLVGLGGTDVWIMDVATGVPTRMTNDGQGGAGNPGAWSPDSQRLATYFGTRKGLLEIAVGSGQNRVLGPAELGANDWSPDGHLLLTTDNAGYRLAAIAPDGDLKPQTISDTPYNKRSFRFAPGGKYVAYASSESGRSEIFVATFPSFGLRRQISIDGGIDPTWRNDGKELFFRREDGSVMSAGIRIGDRIEADVPKPLFKYSTTPVNSTYWPTGDGQRFLVIETQQKNQADLNMVVVNWSAELKP